VWLGPHAPFTCPPDYLREVMRLAADLGTGMHIHVAETRDEYVQIQEAYGKSPVKHLEDVGLFDYPVLAAHCVHVDSEDISILKAHNVGVAHNPESNMKLASGIAPVPEMLKAGIPVALGTDGASSNNNLDMIQEMRSAALLHKVATGDPMVIPSHQALQMATIHGAKALGLEGQVGMLATGYKADLIMIDLERPHLYPRYNLTANLVYSAYAADVRTVIINGEIVMDDRRVLTMDEEEVLRQTERVVGRLVSNG